MNLDLPSTIVLLQHSAKFGNEIDDPVVLHPKVWAHFETLALDPETAERVAQMVDLLHMISNRPAGRRGSKGWKSVMVNRAIVNRMSEAVGYEWSPIGPGADAALVLAPAGPRYPHIAALVARSPRPRPSAQVREELHAYLLADRTNVGFVYRYRIENRSARWIAAQAGNSTGFVYNADATARALLEGELPGGRSLARQVASKVRTASRTPSLSPAAKAHLRALEAALRA